jgi:hypothetical protein
MISAERAKLYKERQLFSYRTLVDLPKRIIQAFQEKDLEGLALFFQSELASVYRFEPSLEELVITSQDKALALLLNQYVVPYKRIPPELFTLCFSGAHAQIMDFLNNAEDPEKFPYHCFPIGWNNSVSQADSTLKIKTSVYEFYAHMDELYSHDLNQLNSKLPYTPENYLTAETVIEYIHHLDLNRVGDLKKISKLFWGHIAESYHPKIASFLYQIGAYQLENSYTLINFIQSEAESNQFLYLLSLSRSGYEQIMEDKDYEPLGSTYFIKSGADLNGAHDRETALDVAYSYFHQIAERHLRKHGAKTYHEVETEAQQQLNQVIAEIWG